MSIHDRGFASMDRNRVREIASKGGKAAHANGKAHEWNSIEAQVAGLKGGRSSQAARRAKLEYESEVASAYAAHTDVRP